MHVSEELGPVSISDSTSYHKKNLTKSRSCEIFVLNCMIALKFASQISKRCNSLNYQSCSLETSRDLTIRHFIGYWNRAQGHCWLRWYIFHQAITWLINRTQQSSYPQSNIQWKFNEIKIHVFPSEKISISRSTAIFCPSHAWVNMLV